MASDDDDRPTTTAAQEEEEAPEASGLGARVEEEEGGGGEDEASASASAPSQPRAPQQATTTKEASTTPIKPYRPWTRFLHPFYWGNAALFAALYAAFRAQWLARAAAAVAASAAAEKPVIVPYSRALTKPSDLLGWERQVLYTFAVIALYKSFLKRRSWDGAVAHYLFYARLLVAVVLFYCDWRWLLLHALACWFSYAALAQPLLDLDAIASGRMREERDEREKQAAGAAGAAAASSSSPPTPPNNTNLISGVSIPLNPPRLRELVLVEESAAEAEAAAAAALAPGGSTKKAAKLMRQQNREDNDLQQGLFSGVGSADYWVLLVGCLSGGHHADSAAYAPAHAALAERYREGNDDDKKTRPRPRLRFAHLDASLFGAFCSSSPVLALPPAQQLAWTRAVPCVLLIDGRTGKELARLPTRAQADDPFRRNLFTAADVERAFDLRGIAGGARPRLAADTGEGGEKGGEEGPGGGGKKKKNN